MTSSLLSEEDESIEAFVKRLSAQARDQRRELHAEYPTRNGIFRFNVRPSHTQTEIVSSFYKWLRQQPVSH